MVTEAAVGSGERPANVAIFASAGTGKTETLVMRCLGLLAGSRGPAIHPSRLALVTFSEKACAEMRARLRRHVDALARDDEDAGEIRARFEARGELLPEAPEFRRMRDELGAATIATYHALCITLIGLPPGAPRPTVLTEEAARRLLRDCVERGALSAMADAPMWELAREIGFRGLSKALMEVYQNVREYGVSPTALHVATDDERRAAFEGALANFKVGADAYAREAKSDGHLLANTVTMITVENFAVHAEELAGLLKGKRGPTAAALRTSLGTGDDGPKNTASLIALHGSTLMAKIERAVVAALEGIAQSHRTELEERRALDFTEMLVRARDLLRDDLDVRRAAQRKFDALLLDEFQDTSRVQLELVMLLAERREGGPRRVNGAARAEAILALPLQPNFVAAVGDEKQSIYAWRGSEADVFQKLSERIVASGGAKQDRAITYRHSRPLVEGLNALWSNLQQRPLADFAQAKSGDRTAKSDLPVPSGATAVNVEAHRTDALAGLPMLQLNWPSNPPGDADQERAEEARAVADFVEALLHSPAPLRASKGGRFRSGDVVLLFSKMTTSGAYREALEARGIRVMVSSDAPPSQEVSDVGAFLRLVENPNDAAALAQVLRSPLVCLSDAALCELAFLPDAPETGSRATDAHGLDARAILTGRHEPSLAGAFELARLRKARGVWKWMRAQRRVLPLHEMVRLTCSETDFTQNVAAGPSAAMALAHLESVVEHARASERIGTTLAEFANELSSPQGPDFLRKQAMAIDGDAVTLSSVHKAKGLEWPVVILPDLNSPPTTEMATIVSDMNLGLAVKPPRFSDAAASSTFMAIAAVRRASQDAERLRQLYVAMTRAKDFLVFGRVPPKPKARSWANWLAPALASAEVKRRLEAMPASGQANASANEHGDVAAPVGARPDSDDDRELHPTGTVPAVGAWTQSVEAAIGRMRTPPVARPSQITVSVTELRTFYLCPTRYHLAHEVGIDGKVAHSTILLRRGNLANAQGRHDALVVGKLVHKLLEKATFAKGAPDGELDRTLNTDDEVDEILDFRSKPHLKIRAKEIAKTFLASPSAHYLGDAASKEMLDREMDVTTALADAKTKLTLTGQVDALVHKADGSIEIFDYKTESPTAANLCAYAFQLKCYRLAVANNKLAPAESIKAGLIFLEGEDFEPTWIADVESTLARESTILELAQKLHEATATHTWQKRELPTCQRHGCPYISICYSSSDPTAAVLRGDDELDDILNY